MLAAPSCSYMGNCVAGNRAGVRGRKEPSLFGSAELLDRCILWNHSQGQAFTVQSLAGNHAAGILAYISN